MSVGLFTDKSNPPTADRVHDAVGSKLPLWHDLIRTIRERYSAQEDFKFLYLKSYDWAVRFRVKGQLLVSLFPIQDGFVAQVNLGPDAIEKALTMKMSKNVQQDIACAHPYPEGRWLFIPIETKEDLSNFQQLVEMRAHAKHFLPE